MEEEQQERSPQNPQSQCRQKYHPTCHAVPLTPMAKFVAFFDMIFGLFGLIWFVLMLSRYNIISLDPFESIGTGNETSSKYSLDNWASGGDSGRSMMAKKQEFATNHKVINLTLVGFYTLINLTVFALLLVGIYRRSPGICLVWFHIRCAIFVFKLIILIMYLIGGRPLFSHVPFILSMLVHLYGLWVVNCYAEELRYGRIEQRRKEVKEKNIQAARENCESYDIPNGIEAIQRRRIEEGLAGNEKVSEKILI